MAINDRTEKRLAGPLGLGTSNGTVGTVPANHHWIIKQVMVCNTAGLDANLTLAVGTSATVSNRFFSTLPIASRDTLVLDTSIVLVAGETIQGFADSLGVNILLYGWEKQVA